MIKVFKKSAIEDMVFLVDQEGGECRLVTGEMLLELSQKERISESEATLLHFCFDVAVADGKNTPIIHDVVAETKKTPGRIKRFVCRLKRLGGKKIALIVGAVSLSIWSLTADFGANTKPASVDTQRPQAQRAAPSVLTFGDPLLAPLSGGEQDKNSGVSQAAFSQDEIDIKNYRFQPKVEMPKVAPPQLSCD